jgi:hypothetical protein
VTTLAAHGIVPAAAELGRSEHGAELVRSGRLAALVTETHDADGRPRRRDLLRHSDVLQEAVRATTVLPLGFGTLFASREELVEELLRPREEEFEALLEELDGTVEMSFTGTLREEAVLRRLVATDRQIAALRESTRGRAEEQSLAERVRLGELVAAGLAARRAELEQLVLDTVTPHAVAMVLPDDPSTTAVQVSLLVSREAVEALEAALEQLARDAADELEARLLGPLPPYSFVRGRAAESLA